LVLLRKSKVGLLLAEDGTRCRLLA
jgi:hypothetical protein